MQFFDFLVKSRDIEACAEVSRSGQHLEDPVKSYLTLTLRKLWGQLSRQLLYSEKHGKDVLACCH